MRALSYLVKNPDSPVLAEIIAGQEDIPKSFLSKIMLGLARAKIVSSIRGRNGGFMLAKDPKSISMFDVIDIFDDLIAEIKVCAIGWEKCSDRNPCDLHHKYKKIREQVRLYFENVSLADFAETRAEKQLKMKKSRLHQKTV